MVEGVPEPATREEIESRWLEGLGAQFVIVSTAINEAAEAERKLSKARVNRNASHEVMMDTARAFRDAEAKMEQTIRDYVRQYQQFLDWQER